LQRYWNQKILAYGKNSIPLLGFHEELGWLSG